MVRLYLDDLRDIPKGTIGARTYEEAVEIFINNNGKLLELSLDHDLGEDEEGVELKNGFDLVKKMIQEGWYASEIYIHTDNPVGRENMYKSLLQAQKRGFISSEIAIFHYGKYQNTYSIEKWI